MAEVFVKNSLNPHKVAKVGVSFIQTVDYNNYDGELVWALEVGTNELNSEGNKISPVYITNLKLDSINEEIEEAINNISSKIDWGDLQEDNYPPYIKINSPTSYITDINTPINFILKERLPSTGIDKDSIKVKINGIDVSDDLYIKGNPFEYEVIWRPKYKVFDTYD